MVLIKKSRFSLLSNTLCLREKLLPDKWNVKCNKSSFVKISFDEYNEIWVGCMLNDILHQNKIPSVTYNVYHVPWWESPVLEYVFACTKKWDEWAVRWDYITRLMLGTLVNVTHTSLTTKKYAHRQNWSGLCINRTYVCPSQRYSICIKRRSHRNRDRHKWEFFWGGMKKILSCTNRTNADRTSTCRLGARGKKVIHFRIARHDGK